MKNVAVIGAGIAGLAAAAQLSRRHRVDRLDQRFIRMWDMYLGSCEAAFLERHTGLFQLVLLKNGAQRVLFNEPWSEPAPRLHDAGASEPAA